MDTTNFAAEDSSGSGEGPRKYQRTNNSDTSRLRKASNASSTLAPRPHPADGPKHGAFTSNTHTNSRRRLSVRDNHKIPLGPRPLLDGQARQRGPSNPEPAHRSFLPPTSTSEPVLGDPIATRPKDSTASTASSTSYDFLPAVTFDDLHASLSEFPAPGRGGIGSFPTTMPAPHSLGQRNPASDGLASGPGPDGHPDRGSSLLRRFSQSRKQPPPGLPNIVSDASSIPPPSSNAGISIRTRRQSHFPGPTPPNPAARAPRKSIGPGMLPDRLDSREAQQELPKLATDAPRTRIGRTPSFGSGTRQGVSSNLTVAPEPQRVSAAARSAKAKSMQPPSRHQSSFLSTPSMTPEARSPGRTQRTQTPSSSASRRQSTMHHVSGLGARTISPTDARRLKRLSMNPNTLRAPASPVTPQGDFTFDEKALGLSPGTVFRNSATPSSARGTPDQNRKSYASGISLSSNSSMNSLRLPTSNLLVRGNPALAGSRLPTPKPRNVHSSAGNDDDEEVPPVPAIPKAFESPKDLEQAKFTFVMGTGEQPPVPPLPQSAPPEPPAKRAVDAPTIRNVQADVVDAEKREPQQARTTIQHRRGFTSGSREIENPPILPQANKKNLQPIRLPPLNLLPLSTSFSNRISSFPSPSADGSHLNSTTPPPKRGNKTPGTPMTASKASFFSRNNSDYFDNSKHLRSSSSAYNLRWGEAPIQSSSAMPIPTLNPERQTATTPYTSESLPKGSALASRPTGEFAYSNPDVEMQNMKVNGPRAPPKNEPSAPAQPSEPKEPGTPSSGTSGLRRKLSLGGWRRSSSKAAHHGSHGSQPNGPQKADQSQLPSKHSEMPPPRLPASATWSGTSVSSPTPSNRTRASVDFQRRKASTATISSDTDTDKQQTSQQNGSAKARVPSGYAESQAKSSSSLLTPMQRMLGSKSSTSVLRARHLDPNIDRDDLAADEEMRKLASKRKDFEQAARDVDELRKRARPQERVTPAQALQMVNLNIFERGEIIDYKEIYFCGTKNAKKHVGDLSQQTLNFGYDDDRGDYNIVLGDHLAYRYEVVDILGKGSFGQVVRCVDHKTGLLVAIKIIRNKKRFHQQALVEVNILQKLREWDPDNKHSMINFTQSFYFRGHLCISTELLGMNLYEFIKAHDFKGFSLRLIRRFCKQMLSSLVLLRSHRVIHCDLKPENILLAHPLHSEIKVIDFGSSCFEHEKVYTYIQSRFYRSPEVILGMSYGLPIDMWSLGCILAELLTGYPIFPGENEQEQLACIMEIFGPPEKHLIEKSSRKKLFFDSLGKPRVTVSTKGRRRRPSSKTLQQALKCDDEAFLDFIARCLRWDPDRRMKPDEAMLHEFVTGVRKTRTRPPMNGSSAMSSPAKRMAPVPSSQQRVRPLPEPPVAGIRNSSGVHSSSPIKGPRRHSTVQGAPSSGAVKRAANGVPLNASNTTSGLPRVAQRSVSGKPDLASSAAAAASLKTR